jgi:hypothetical protein
VGQGGARSEDQRRVARPTAAAGAPLLATPYAPLVGIIGLYGAIVGQGTARAIDASTRGMAYPSPLVLPFRCDPAGIDNAALEAAPLGIAVRACAWATRSSTPAADAPWQVIVALDAIHFDFRDDFVYLIPLGPLTIERRDVTLRMALTVSVIDDGGAVRWSRSDDAGRELWKALRGPVFATETPAEGVQRLAHQQTWRLMTRAAQDVRRFVEADGGRERVL